MAVLSSPVVKCLRDRNPFAGDPEGDVNVESDCERDLSEVTNGLPEVEGDGEALPRAVLTFGSFSAYEYSHFFYPCLGLTKTTNSTGGNHSFSIDAQTKSRSLPLDLKVSSLARITSARRRLRELPLPALRRAYTFWRIWYGDPQWEVTRNSNALND